MYRQNSIFTWLRQGLPSKSDVYYSVCKGHQGGFIQKPVDPRQLNLYRTLQPKDTEDRKERSRIVEHNNKWRKAGMTREAQPHPGIIPYLKKDTKFWRRFGLQRFIDQPRVMPYWIQMHPVFAVKARGDPCGRLIIDYACTCDPVYTTIDTS